MSDIPIDNSLWDGKVRTGSVCFSVAWTDTKVGAYAEFRMTEEKFAQLLDGRMEVEALIHMLRPLVCSAVGRLRQKGPDMDQMRRDT